MWRKRRAWSNDRPTARFRIPRGGLAGGRPPHAPSWEGSAMRSLFAACAVAALALTAAEPAATANRRDLEDPELIVDSGGRLGMCDALHFTPDGRELLAVGDDKVVRIWQYPDGKL